MMSRLPTLLLLAVALFTGFVPLRRCDATTGGSGVVPLGQHGHVHHAADGSKAHGSCACAHGRAHDHARAHGPAGRQGHADDHTASLEGVGGCEHGDRTPPSHDRCCVDSPFDAGLASAPVALALHALVPPGSFTAVGFDAAHDCPAQGSARADAPPDSLRSVRTTVLLR